MTQEFPNNLEKNLSNEWLSIDKTKEDTFSEIDEDAKIDPKIELLESPDDIIYKTDFKGNLQLVNETIPIHQPSKNEEKQQTESAQDCSSAKLSTVISSATVSEQPCENNLYEHFENIEGREKCFIKEEPCEDSTDDCSYGHCLPEIYDYNSTNSWESLSDNASQSEIHIPNGSTLLMTQAEKKRLYRLRMKEENPAMWNMIKQREAARKKEHREKRREILDDMRRAMECIESSDTSETQNQKNYLENLIQRYPDLWDQLMDATQITNELLLTENTGKRTSFKPAKMYKDVIAAQKKRLYRQRIREERPEMYERQKARDAYARSMQRFMLKKKAEPKNELVVDSGLNRKLPYLHTLQSQEAYSDSSGKNFLPHCVNEPGAETNSCNGSVKTEPETICDTNKLEDEPSSESLPEPSTPCPKDTTQSDVLWFWNDIYNKTPPHPTFLDASNSWRKGPQVLSEEERMLKIAKERLQVRERRRRYRQNMAELKRRKLEDLGRRRVELVNKTEGDCHQD